MSIVIQKKKNNIRQSRLKKIYLTILKLHLCKIINVTVSTLLQTFQQLTLNGFVQLCSTLSLTLTTTLTPLNFFINCYKLCLPPHSFSLSSFSPFFSLIPTSSHLAMYSLSIFIISFVFSRSHG